MTRAARPSRRWGHAAAGWAAVFALVHLYWALGGTVGLAESAGRQLADERPTAFVLGGLYGVALVLVAAAALGMALARGRVAGRRRILSVLAAGVAAVLLLRAVVIEALLLADVDYGNGGVSAEQRWWMSALGVLFALWGSCRTPEARTTLPKQKGPADLTVRGALLSLPG